MPQTKFLVFLILGIQLQIILGLPLCSDYTSTVLNSVTDSVSVTCTSATSPVQVSYTAISTSSSAAIQVTLDGDSHVINQNSYSGAINAGSTFSSCNSPLLEVGSVTYTLTLTLLNPSESGPTSVEANITVYQTVLDIDAPYNETYEGCCTRFYQFYINPEDYGNGGNANNAYRTTISLSSGSQIPFDRFSLFSQNLCSAGSGVVNRTIGNGVTSIQWEIDDMGAGWWFIALDQSNQANYEINVQVEESYSDASCSASGFCSSADDSSSGKSSPWYTWFSPVLAFFIVLAVFFSIIGFTEKKEEEQNFTEWAFESVNLLKSKKKKDPKAEKKYQV